MLFGFTSLRDWDAQQAIPGHEYNHSGDEYKQYLKICSPSEKQFAIAWKQCMMTAGKAGTLAKVKNDHEFKIMHLKEIKKAQRKLGEYIQLQMRFKNSLNPNIRESCLDSLALLETASSILKFRHNYIVSPPEDRASEEKSLGEFIEFVASYEEQCDQVQETWKNIWIRLGWLSE